MSALALSAGCNTAPNTAAPVVTNTAVDKPIEGNISDSLPGHSSIEDNSKKEGPRLLPPETYMRTYLQFFDNKKTPLELETYMRGLDDSGVFDRWADYLGSLGMPDYKLDVGRQDHTNTLMVASLERLGIALCIRKAEVELNVEGAPPPLSARTVFAFDMTPQNPTDTEFLERFDKMHRIFLGYPVSMADPKRVPRFLGVFRDIIHRHEAAGAPTSRFTPQQAGWAGMCYALVRHPEFQMY